MTQTRNAQHDPQEVPVLGVDPQAPRRRRSRATSIAVLMSLALALTIAVPRYRVVEDSAPASERDAPAAVAAPLIDWQAPEDPPPPLLPATLVGFRGGFAAVAEPAADPAAAWIANPTGATWTRVELPATPTGLTPYGPGLLGFRNRTLWSIRPSLGGEWRIEQLLELPDLARLGYGSGRPAIVAVDNHILLQSPEGEVWQGDPAHGYQLVIPRGTWSLNIRDPWEAATRAQPPGPCRPPAIGAVDYVPILSIESGLIALVSGSATSPHGRWPQCEPRVWTSVDGREWQPGGEGSGFPPTTYIYDAATRNGALMAVGGSGPGVPGLYTSTDGRVWTRAVTRGLPGFDDYQPTQITAGPAGWIVLARQVNAPATTGWVSIDGECWETLPAYLEPRAAAVGTTHFVVATSTGRSWTGSPTGTCQ